MTRIRLQVLLVLALMAVPSAHAQETDLAAERGRLANQRIEAEAVRRAQEEAAREEAARKAAAASQVIPPQPAPAATREPPFASQASAPPRPASEAPAESRAEMSRALEQLRDLGELRDSGYVTDEEFERIKQRILDERF